MDFDLLNEEDAPVYDMLRTRLLKVRQPARQPAVSAATRVTAAPHAPSQLDFAELRPARRRSRIGQGGYAHIFRYVSRVIVVPRFKEGPPQHTVAQAPLSLSDLSRPLSAVPACR